MTKHSTAEMVLAVAAAVTTWFFLGGLLAVAGVLLTSFIPFAGLGVFLGLLGALLHIILIVLNVRPAGWKAGALLSIALSTFSIVSGTLSGDRFPVSFMLFFAGYYFLFGSFFYLFIQKVIVESIIE